MSKTYTNHPLTDIYLKCVRNHKEPYCIDVLGKEIIVYPNVMSPKYDRSSRFHISNMPEQEGKDFLEIGCGCGVIALFAAFQGAKQITAVDINPNAIENTKENFKKHDIRNIKVFYSDLFSKIENTFDTITFALPYYGTEPKDMLEHGISDHNYKTLRRLMKESPKYLKKKGQLILGFSDWSDIELLGELIEENNYKLIDRKEETANGWTAYLYVLALKDWTQGDSNS